MLILERPWTRQPQGVVGVDWSNPLTSALCVAVHGADRYLQNKNGRKIWTTNGTTKTATARGIALQCHLSQTNLEWASYEPIVTADGIGLNNFTLMVCANPAAGSGAVQHLIAQKNDAGGAPYSQCFISSNADNTNTYSSGGVTFGTYGKEPGGVTSSSMVSKASVCDGNFHVFAGVRRFTSGSNSDHILYVDGVVGATSNLVNRDLIETPTRYLAIGSRGNGTTESFNDKIVFAYAWNRALSDAEVAQVSENPWQLFQPRRIYIPTATAAGYTHPTLSLATATEIGATSFKPRVTYTFA